MNRIETMQHPERRAFFLLLALLVLFCAIYGYFLNTAIMRVVAREAAMENISDLDGRLSELEFKYIAMQKEITIDRAYELGFVNVEPPVFVSRGTGRNLTLLSNPSGI